MLLNSTNIPSSGIKVSLYPVIAKAVKQRVMETNHANTLLAYVPVSNIASPTGFAFTEHACDGETRYAVSLSSILRQ